MDLISGLFSFLFSWTGILLIGIVSALYLWGTYHNGIFERRGVAHLKPVVFFGHNLRLVLRLETFIDTFQRSYKAFPNESVVGFMQTTTPIFMVRDPVLIKEITVKHFENFRNHLFGNDPDIDPIFGKSLFSMKDQKWKITRNLLSPAFTGSKMRIMFKLMRDCAEKTVNGLVEKTDLKHGKPIDLEIKDFFTRYANDTIATTIFGIEVNSVGEPENEFYMMGRKMTNFGPAASVKFLLSFVFPSLFKLLGLNILEKESSQYFVKLVKDTIEYRIEKNIERPDILNMYIESLKNDNMAINDNEYSVKVDGEMPKKWDYDEFVCQCILFFFAGFETTASFFMFVAHELTVNSDVQQKLIDEIDEINSNLGDKGFVYETLNSLKYLDMVINETARKWPITGGLDRRCNKDITLYDSRGRPIHFKDGDNLNLAAYGIQRDPVHYEDPEKFIPERFSPENKDKINPFANINFGIGPRMCLGNRFALTECKCIFYTLLSKFKFEMSKKTQHPLKFRKGGFAFIPENGAWVKLVPRINA